MCAFACRPAVAGMLALAGLAATAGARAEGLAMRLNGFTSSPVGYTEFCKAAPAECRAQGAQAAEHLTEARWRDLLEVNTFANRIVIPATDAAFYDKEEVWALPENYGDCEDYVLLKRKWLIEKGWPTGALLISVVFDEVGEGHAVLLVRTDRGEFVLDNKVDTIRPWFETAYRYVKRQSVKDPNRWVSVGDPRWTATSTATSR